MNITNIHGLPEALVRAVKHDTYTGGGDISTTRLIDSPQIRALQKKYSKAIVEDVADRLWSLMGQAIHHVLERAAEDNAIVEKRYFMDVEGWKLSGQIDRMLPDEGILQDWKFVSTWKADGDDSWTKQLNILRQLVKANGYEVKQLEVVAIFRDWSRATADRDKDYPQSPVKIIRIDVWSDEKAMDYIKERVIAHQKADTEPALCSDEERWKTATTYALMKEGGKRATKVALTIEDLGEVKPGYEVVKREGSYKRCESFCQVSAFCDQFKKDRKVDDE